MSLTASIWLIIVAALVAANLPFINQRWLGVVPRAGRKPLAVRLAEMALLYAAVGLLGVALERRAGQVAAQGWEFYVVTGTLFLTFAFPGFVYQYMWSRGRE